MVRLTYVNEDSNQTLRPCKRAQGYLFYDPTNPEPIELDLAKATLIAFYWIQATDNLTIRDEEWTSHAKPFYSPI